MKSISVALCLLLGVSVAAQVPSPTTVRVTDGEAIQVLLVLDNPVRPDRSPRNRICAAQAGDEGEVTSAVAAAGSERFWARIRFAGGPCNGQEGWISSERIQPK